MPRLSFILTVAMLSTFGLIASDIYLPAMPSMTTEFDIADWQMPQTVSFYLLALAISQLAYGPLSDRYGRKPVVLAGGVLYLIGSLGCAASGSYVGFLAWRMVEAVGAAAGLVIGRALIADTCDKRISAKVYAVVYPLVSLSPALAPAIGGHLAVAFGWRADFLFVAAFGAVALLMALTLLPETLPVSARTRTSPFAGFSHVLRDRTFRRYTLVVCTIYCAWFVYLTQSPFLFVRAGLSEEQSGWLYLPLTAGIVGANLLAKRLLDRWPPSALHVLYSAAQRFSLPRHWGGLARRLWYCQCAWSALLTDRRCRWRSPVPSPASMGMRLPRRDWLGSARSAALRLWQWA
ncbi:multidrug effflux MFS transporter [Pseudomonas sp. B5(2017)]|uniref:multidrug effflux MFS transporter n=1 Tax=Pseudomonas sp. B5(2017) TaxID=1981714 RepID=UPI0021156F81|nr:multidrug effflux MFS transporter [Pseudomonas sp. B5(2017)]